MNKHKTKPQGSYISYFSNLVKRNGGLNLAQGIPGFQPPVELRKALEEMVHSNVHQYAPGLGNFRLLNLIHSHYSKSYKVDIENFLVVQGATEAISLIYTCLTKRLGRDFGVLSFDPAYETYSQLPQIFGQPFVSYPLNNEFSIDFDELKKSILENNIKIIFLSSPGNPFGKTWSKDEVNHLVKLAEELNFYLIFDAVYKDLYFDNEPYLPLHHNSPNVFYVNSFSKMLCITGWRIGYLYAHEQHRKAIRSIHDYIGLCAPSILQEALATYLEDYGFGSEFVEGFRNNVKANFDFLAPKLTRLGFTIPPTNGGCFIWAKLPKGINDGFDFANELYSQVGVATIPGEHFSKNYASWLRINIARPAEEIEKAANLIEQFILAN
jgi:aspartate/methionine/tyrosine aminotransferase